MSINIKFLKRLERWCISKLESLALKEVRVPDVVTKLQTLAWRLPQRAHLCTWPLANVNWILLLFELRILTTKAAQTRELVAMELASKNTINNMMPFSSYKDRNCNHHCNDQNNYH